MKADKYKVTGKTKYHTGDFSTGSGKEKSQKEKLIEETRENQQKIALLQDRLYADGREGLIIILQAMDAAGKDGTIKHVMSGINPQGVDVCSFKTPSSEELAHDFLWRIHKCVPARGKIGLFNRSYYEDVLVVKVHNMNEKYQMAERVTGQKKEKFFSKRYEQIVNYEEYLYENSYRIVKIFLNVSREEQKKRFLERIDNPNKNWKFSSGDITERQYWDDYQKAYEQMINHTATKENPWYIIPADDKWYTRYLVSQIVLKTLEKMDPQYPVIPGDEKERLSSCREMLEKEEQE